MGDEYSIDVLGRRDEGEGLPTILNFIQTMVRFILPLSYK